MPQRAYVWQQVNVLRVAHVTIEHSLFCITSTLNLANFRLCYRNPWDPADLLYGIRYIPTMYDSGKHFQFG